MQRSKLYVDNATAIYRGLCFLIGAGAILILTSTPFISVVAAQQKSFSSPEEAVKAAIAAAKDNNDKELLAIFGPSAKDLLFSGDTVADRQRRAEFVAAYDQKTRRESQGEEKIVVVGNEDWPLPFPIMKRGNGWVFDIERGR